MYWRNKSMANELFTLKDLFQNKLFRIPDYQRGYAWRQQQLIDFWDDLVNLSDNRYHYTGMLSLKKLNNKSEEIKDDNDKWMIDKGFAVFHIVDGQQRLTTIIILLNELIEFYRNLDENKEKEDDKIFLAYDSLKEIISKYIFQLRPPLNQIRTYLFEYESDNPSSEYLRYKVFGEPYSKTIIETYYTKNLKYAKDFFKENIVALYKLKGKEEIISLYRKLTQNLMFNIYEFSDDYDVFVAFETMNNRGKKLTNLELLKNRLIYLTTLYNGDFDELEKKNLRKTINDAWREVYYQLGRNDKALLSDDDFLRAHWITYFAYSRKRGDDYIHFLLDKFSAKNIFEITTMTFTTEINESGLELSDDGNDLEEADDSKDTEKIEPTKLEPKEIYNYVNSLKELSKYWYDTFFPNQNFDLSDDERLWIDRLNRIGIGYFRPLIMIAISRCDIETEKRVELFEAIERFIFVIFRLGGYNSTYNSSVYYNAARDLYLKKVDIKDLINNINNCTNLNIEYVIPNFITKVESLFENKDGYYSWKPIKYFLYEYESYLAKNNKLNKLLSWELFTNNEKDKVSIEHILPQTPTNYYWRNQFRQFSDQEIKQLSGALGNLLALSQSVNSSLQNDSFGDKKEPKNKGRRGYKNGSHSEIEVSKYDEWNANCIYERSKMLLNFMEKRWKISFSSDQLNKLIYVTWVNDGRNIPDPLTEIIDDSSNGIDQVSKDNLKNMQLQFWTSFKNYCKENGRESDIASQEPKEQNYYNVYVNGDYHLAYTVKKSKILTILIYTNTKETFERIEAKKDIIEALFGDKLDWYSSPVSSEARRIVYNIEADVFNPSMQEKYFQWMIDTCDKLSEALIKVGEKGLKK